MPLGNGELERAIRARVVFAHQSVGQNILDGVRTMIAPRTLAWVDVLNGQNGQPLGKLQAFRDLVERGAGRDAAMALFKFCYVDFDRRTNVEELFDAYRRTMARIARDRPRAVVAHVTVPLTTVASGPRAWAKRLLGAPAWGEAENQKRHAFNELLRGEYRSEPLFDLARLESGEPRNRQRYEQSGKSVPMLRSAYTDDGGHLNAVGRRVVAEELLRFVATQSDGHADRSQRSREGQR
jgi:hypothetical protein